MRKSKVQGYLDVAKEIAERSPCTRRKFGAVIVKDDMIISTGYNGTMRGALNCGIDVPCLKDLVGEEPYKSYEYCPAIHAEQNACIIAGRERAIGGIMYLAPALGQGDRPCQKCRRAINAAGLSKVIYIGKDGSIQEDDVNLYVKLEDEWMMGIIDEYDPGWKERVFEEDITLDFYCEKCGGFIEETEVGEVLDSPHLPSKAMVGMRVCSKCLGPIYMRERMN